MGYMSEVVFSLTNKVYHEFEKVKRENKELREFLENADEHFAVGDEGKEEKHQLFHWYSVKWNDMRFPSERAITSFVSEHTDDCRLIIIGEEMNDIEDVGHLIDDAFDTRLVRTIEYDPPRS